MSHSLQTLTNQLKICLNVILMIKKRCLKLFKTLTKFYNSMYGNFDVFVTTPVHRSIK